MASKRHANSKQQRSSLPDPSAVEKDKTLRATICHASDISDVQKRAVEELQRFLELLFGANVVSMVGEQLPERCPAPRETLFILGVPTLSPWIGQILADLDQTPLIEQEYQIRPVEIGHSQALLLAGGSPAAVLWAVYEFG